MFVKKKKKTLGASEKKEQFCGFVTQQKRQ